MKAKDYPFAVVLVSCATCGRQGRYSRERFVELVKTETALPDALALVAADCLKRQSAAIYDQCMALYPDLMADRPDSGAKGNYEDRHSICAVYSGGHNAPLGKRTRAI